MFREPITLDMTEKDIVMLLSEGNPGALTVLMAMAMENHEFGIINMLNLDDMNMRGEQIWIAYKDYSGENKKVFWDNIMKRNQSMISMVNERSSTEERAVTSGGSRRGEI